MFTNVQIEIYIADSYTSNSIRIRSNSKSHNDSRPFCFPVPTKTLSYNSCVFNQFYFIVRLNIDQTVGQLNLPHTGITKTEKNRTKT